MLRSWVIAVHATEERHGLHWAATESQLLYLRSEGVTMGRLCERVKRTLCVNVRSEPGRTGLL